MNGADQRRVTVSYGDPSTGMINRLPLQVGVSGFIPVQNRVREIIENNVPSIGSNGQHCMPVAVRASQYSQEQV